MVPARADARKVEAGPAGAPYLTELRKPDALEQFARRGRARRCGATLIAPWHALSRGEPFKPSASSAPDPAPASSSIRLVA